ncbi:hypothetical protein PBI_OMNICRON_29 [Mycobacterium phage Omnicron]|uniref:Uncharacterized protein n=1 Tax=Mycobacterium phage Omnicron TaxID=1541819 RepID=A0A088FRE1_9CAUD|nr:hypothetical protein PBI_OMNICRON_29 [Mycobacterium phage Omnicron]AIM50362.1 hypothetical protein PBI_OMNICRON_29 [Mycobacterium phage Omnicron]
MSEYQAAHRRACCAAVTALGNRIGLFAGATRVGTVSADTTWGTPVDINEPVDPAEPMDPVTNPNVDKARATGSTVTITVPGGTVANGAVIDRYGVFNGATLLRSEVLPFSILVNDGSQQVQIDVTPVFKYRGE